MGKKPADNIQRRRITAEILPVGARTGDFLRGSVADDRRFVMTD
jgi:hypothetical protein